MQSAKETAANVAASAKCGMEKTKATVQEKGEKMTARDPLQKDIAEEKKEERMNQADLQKNDVHQHITAARQAAGSYKSGMGHGHTTGGQYATDTTQDPNVAGGVRTGYGSGATY